MTTPASAAARAGLAAYRQAESDAYNASDPGLADHFTEDFILTSNGVPTLRGRESVREFFRELWKHNHARFVEVIDEDVVEHGDLLLVAGRFVLEVKPKAGGAAIVDRGRYQGVLKRGADGRYRLWREGVSDAGPAAQSSAAS
jgi:ketosteroid isomerase-like protein